MRTVRIQGGQSCLPPRGLGTFHLLNTQPYRNQLPPKAVALGGLFLPMYESEAMYITFDCQASDKFVVRPFLGGVNGISGKRLYSSQPHYESKTTLSPPSSTDWMKSQADRVS